MRSRTGPQGILLAATLLAPSAAAGLEVPFLAGRVNDLADLVPPEVEMRLEARLERLENERGAQVVVLTVPSLEGEILEEYSLRVAETWGIGRGEADDGALLLIARDDRKMRLEVGYGLEPTITDLASKRILDDLLRPRFRAGDFAGGIEAAVEAMAGLIAGEDVLPRPAEVGSKGAIPDLPGRLAAGALFLLVVGIFSLAAIATQGCAGWFLYLFLIPFWIFFPLGILGMPAGAVAAGLWIVGFPILWLWVHRSRPGKAWRKRHSRGLFGQAWSSSGGWRGGGGRSGGGGFSGGGGSFGGGGASGSCRPR
jgi:uncharacterized protein